MPNYPIEEMLQDGATDSALLRQAVDLLRNASPALHLCFPSCDTNHLSDAWWKKREQILEYFDSRT